MMDLTPERTLTYITIHLLGDATHHTQQIGRTTVGAVRLGGTGMETVSIQSTDPEHLKQLASALVACADEMTMTGIGKAVPA